MKLIPYVAVNGAWSISDNAMTGVFDLMQEHRLDKAVFYSGGINRKNFIDFMKSSQNVVHTIWDDNEFPVAPNILMLAWLNRFGSNHGMAHFCCFPKGWGKTSKELAHKTLDYWFGDFFVKDDGTPLLDVLIGFTPSDNRLAVRWIKQIGMTIVGNIPLMDTGQKRAGMVVSYITREDFKNG